MKIISFYTPDYKQDIDNLICSLKKFNIPYDIEELPKVKPLKVNDTWVVNCAEKAKFINHKIRQVKDTVIWLDADSIVIKYPKYFDVIEEDIAVYYEYQLRLKSGTILFKYNDTVLEVLDRWQKQCELAPTTFDQIHLQHIIKGFYQELHKLSVFFLPDSYCWMKDVTKVGEPTILHTQASRRFR